MVDPAWLRLRAVACAAANAGGRAALARFHDRERLAVEAKSDESPVTIADREAEAACQATIVAAYPDDAWLGEESGGRGETGAVGTRRWIVDPIDGTRNFVRGVPLWATLVACEEVGPAGTRVVASAVAIPALDELYDAVLGGGARLDGAPIRVSPVATLAGALWCFEARHFWRKAGLDALFDHLGDHTQLQRGLADAYGHMLVASGRAEVVVEPSLAVWDVAATSLVVSEAGGRFSDLDGAPSIRSNNAVVSNGRVHDETLALIARLRRKSP